MMSKCVKNIFQLSFYLILVFITTDSSYVAYFTPHAHSILDKKIFPLKIYVKLKALSINLMCSKCYYILSSKEFDIMWWHAV